MTAVGPRVLAREVMIRSIEVWLDACERLAAHLGLILKHQVVQRDHLLSRMT